MESLKERELPRVLPQSFDLAMPKEKLGDCA